MDENMKWFGRTQLETAAAALEKNGFRARVFEGREEALAYLLEAAQGAETLGFGGSMTLTELGLAARVAELGKQTLVHGRPGLSMQERIAIMKEQQRCDLFFTSTNALTLRGHLVNIDGTGNRVCAMAFGPKKVIVVVGANKLAKDLEAGLTRARHAAAPPNARRLGYDTPCAKTGQCSDCNSPQRICRITTIIEKKPSLSDVEIVLINESLGY